MCMKNTIKDEQYYFYTDGATSGNGTENAKGGWAWIRASYEDELISICESGSGFEDNSTNNRCELLGVINACEFAQKEGYIPALIYSDSAYVINCYKDKWYKNWIYNGWVNYKREPVKNRDLWEKLIPFFRNPNFEFSKIKGHNGIIENELVDDLARKASIGGTNA